MLLLMRVPHETRHYRAIKWQSGSGTVSVGCTISYQTIGPPIYSFIFQIRLIQSIDIFVCFHSGSEQSVEIGGQQRADGQRSDRVQQCAGLLPWPRPTGDQWPIRDADWCGWRQMGHHCAGNMARSCQAIHENSGAPGWNVNTLLAYSSLSVITDLTRIMDSSLWIFQRHTLSASEPHS